MQKSIRKPQNWQDFETLCKKLWSEEFASKNFKKNGRNGQKQDGVDIYGIPKGQANYYGIQCKLKTDNGKLTAKEIAEEIAFAEKFEPPLEHLIIASTTPKDVEIEKFVRLQDIERRKQKKFGVELYCWEDIESLLSENYQTYQWYLHNLDVQKQYAVQVCFNDEKTEIVVRPKLFRKIKKYVYVPSKKEIELTTFQKQQLEATQAMLKSVQMPSFDLLQNMNSMFGGRCKVNYAWCHFKIFFENCGGGALKHWELRFYIDSENGVFDDPSEHNNFLIPPANIKPRKIEWEHEVLYHDPDHYPFVQNDSRFIELSVRPTIKAKKIPIYWELLAEDFSDKGELILIVEPEITEKEEIIEVSNKNEERVEKMPLEYFCEYPKDDEDEK